MKKAVKGTYGYLQAKRNRVVLRTILFFAICLALFITGYVQTGSRRNLLTVVAILGCLPSCKSFVNMVMYLRAKGCSSTAMEAIQPFEGRLVGMYDMYFTSYRTNFAISHMVLENKVLLAFTEDPHFDFKACTEHLSSMLKQGGVKDMTITITDDPDKYCGQLKTFNEKAPEGNPEKDDEARVILYDISL